MANVHQLNSAILIIPSGKDWVKIGKEVGDSVTVLSEMSWLPYEKSLNE